MTKSITIRFEPNFAEQVNGGIKRIVGFVKAKYVCELLDNVTLEANPRSAKINSVVNGIIDELPSESNIFPFKTKGILIAASQYERWERRRYKLIFNETEDENEGLLDGGHNMLALGIYFLKRIDAEIIKNGKIKFWEDMKKVWDEHREEIRKIQDQFDFKLPVELLVPENPEDVECKDSFRNALFSICAARNNNAELSLWTKENKKGFYDLMQSKMLKEIRDRIEWKTNEWGDKTKKPIHPRDIIALVWIPLLVLKEANRLPLKNKVTPQHIYSNKGRLSIDFDKLMGHTDVSGLPRNGRYELHNSSINSAFEMLSVLPVLYDLIFLNIKAAYNENRGNFANIGAVTRGECLSPYLQKTCNYNTPGGFIVPILCGLRALMGVDDSGKVFWKTDPEAFLDKHMVELVKTFKLAMDMANLDPQKVATNAGSYALMFDKVNMLYEMSQH